MKPVIEAIIHPHLPDPVARSTSSLNWSIRLHAPNTYALPPWTVSLTRANAPVRSSKISSVRSPYPPPPHRAQNSRIRLSVLELLVVPRFRWLSSSAPSRSSSSIDPLPHVSTFPFIMTDSVEKNSKKFPSPAIVLFLRIVFFGAGFHHPGCTII